MAHHCGNHLATLDPLSFNVRSAADARNPDIHHSRRHMLKVHTFRQLLLQAHESFGERTFLLDDGRLGRVTYTDVLLFARGLEQQLDALGIQRGARVAMVLHNCGLAALLFLAVIASRRVLIPLNPLSTQDELEDMLVRSDCAAVIGDPRHSRAHTYGATRQILISDHRRYIVERCAVCDHMYTCPDAAGDTTTFVGEIVFTSGSTGRPKGIVLSEHSLIANSQALAEVYGLGSEDRFLTVCPLFHNSGQMLTTLACALVGGSTAAVKSDVGMLNFWAYVDRYRANWSLGMTSFLALLLSRSGAPQQPTSLRGLLTGGSTIDASLIRRFESKFGVPVRTVYGLTETSSISTCEYADPNPRSLGSSGRPLSICDVRIGSEPRVIEPPYTPTPYERGEIWISGPTLFDSYVGDPELTRSRKHGGWLQTGDLGYFDENGNLFVVDRLDSMLIVGGENVYPAEIEKLCTSLPGASEIVLAGIDQPIWGKELVLVYRAEEGIIPSIGEWHRTLSGLLSAAKLPQRYFSLRELGLVDFPRKQNGKLDRQVIAALVKAKVSDAHGSAM